MFHNTPSQPSKFRTKNWFEINDRSDRVYNTDSKIKFKILVIRSYLCDYSDVCILVKGTTTVKNTETVAAPNNRNKKVIFKRRAPFTDFIRGNYIATIIQKYLEVYGNTIEIDYL